MAASFQTLHSTLSPLRGVEFRHSSLSSTVPLPSHSRAFHRVTTLPLCQASLPTRLSSGSPDNPGTLHQHPFPGTSSPCTPGCPPAFNTLSQPRHADVSCHATILAGTTPGTQRYVIPPDGAELVMPVTPVQHLPVAAQAAVFLGIFAVLGMSTYLVCTQWSLGWSRTNASVYTLSTFFILAGFLLRYTKANDLCSMVPAQGSWGFWYLPGSDLFHVIWTGVAEVFSGVGLLASTIPSVSAAFPQLRQVTALCLFVLMVAVTPANIYNLTHNAPFPSAREMLKPGEALPVHMHIIRLAVQVVLWAALWGLSFP